MRLISVVLPAPFGPMRPRISPGETRKVTSLGQLADLENRRSRGDGFAHNRNRLMLAPK